MTDIRDERIVKFTPNEVSELADFLRTFEANPVAVRLLHGISTRSLDAVADDIPANGVPLTDLEHEVLSRIAELEGKTIDGYVKPLYGMEGTSRELAARGLARRHLRADLYMTTEAGRAALADNIINTEEPSA